MNQNIFGLLLLCLLIALTGPSIGCGGCGDASEPSPDGSDMGVVDVLRDAGTCIPDPDLIAEVRECRRDDQCPCGTNCTLGRCSAECMSSDDCATGELCDAFGLCRLSTADAVVAPSNAVGEGRPRILQGNVISQARDTPQLVTIVADDGPIAVMRLTADPGTEIALAEPGTESQALTYSAEIVVDEELPEGEARHVYTRPAVDTPDGEPVEQSGISVVTGPNASTSVIIDDAAAFRAPPLPPVSLDGVYEGSARLVLSGASGGVRGFEGAPPIRDVSTLISAEVFADSGDRAVIVIRDPLHLIHPAGEWVGEIVLDDNPRVEMPAFEQVAPVSLAGSQIQVVTVANDGVLLRDPSEAGWSGSLRFKLDLEFVGTSTASLAPRQIWEFGIGRTADPSGTSAPPVDEAADAAMLGFEQDISARAPFNVEQAFLDAIIPTTASGPATLIGFSSAAPVPGAGPWVEVDITLPARDVFRVGNEITLSGATGASAAYYNGDQELVKQLSPFRADFGFHAPAHPAPLVPPDLFASVHVYPDRFQSSWLRDRSLQAAVSSIQRSSPRMATTTFCAGPSGLDEFADKSLLTALSNMASAALTANRGGMAQRRAPFHNPAVRYDIGMLLGTCDAASWVPACGPQPPVEAHRLSVMAINPTGTVPGVLASWAGTPLGAVLKGTTFQAIGGNNADIRFGGEPAWFGPWGTRTRPSVLALGGTDIDDFQFTMRDGSTLEFAVPCAFDLSGVTPTTVLSPSAGVGDVPIEVGFDPTLADNIDVCEQIALDHECTIVDLDALAADPTDLERSFWLSLELNYASASYPDEHRATLELAGAAYSKACVFPQRSVGCVESAICDDARDAGRLFSPSQLRPLVTQSGTQPGEYSHPGDLRCRDGSAGMVMPMDGATTNSDLLDTACSNDIDALFALSAVDPTGADSAARLDSIDWRTPVTEGCLEPARFLTLLGLSGETARTLGPYAPNRAVDTTDTIFLRLLQRYLQAHSLATARAINGGDLAEAFATGDAVADLELALESSLRAWDLLMHPRIGSALAGISASALADPDYRLRLIESPLTPDERYTQDDGLPTSIMSLLATQMELIEKIAAINARAGGDAVPDSVIEALRRIGVIDAYVTMLSDRGGAYERATTPGWFAGYQLAQGRFESARARALLSLSAAVAGRNPLGIEDEDLPLYFSQVATDAGSRYTAISDYILGDPAMPFGVATNAVEDALDVFEDAKSAYIAEEARQVNIVNDDADWMLRVKTARLELGTAIQDLCGESLYPGQSAETVSNLYSAEPARYSIDEDADGNQVLIRAPGAVDFSTCWYRSDLADCAEDDELDERLQEAQAYDALVAKDLQETMEANAYHELCVAALVAGEAELPRCDDELVFPDYGGKYGAYEPEDRVGGCLFEKTVQWNDSNCRLDDVPVTFITTPSNPSGRPEAGSAGLRRLDQQMRSAAFGWPYYTFQAFLKTYGYNSGGYALQSERLFPPAGEERCDSLQDATVSKITPSVPWGTGENLCANGPPGAIGPIPRVIYEPGARVCHPSCADDPGCQLKPACIVQDSTCIPADTCETWEECTLPQECELRPLKRVCRAECAGDPLCQDKPSCVVEDETCIPSETCATWEDCDLPASCDLRPQAPALRLECEVFGTMFTEYVSQPDMAVSLEIDAATLADATATCDTLFKRRFTSSIAEPTKFEVTRSACYRGSLGSQAASVRGLVGQIESAEAEAKAITDEHRISMQSCFLQQAGNTRLNLAQSKYEDERKVAQQKKLAMSILAKTARTVEGCISAVNGVDTPETPPAIIGTVFKSYGAAAECGLGAVAAAFESAVDGLEFEIENLDTAHGSTMLQIETDTEDSRCFKEAELALVNQRTLDLNVLIAAQEMEAAYADFIDEIEKAELTAIRGVDNIEEMIRSRSDFVGRNPWFNDEIERYNRKMRLARRAAYLAVRAVEYEFQMTSTYRGEVLLAKDPVDLEQVLDSLRSINATPSPNGAQPTELTEVFSLREHLLQVGDQVDVAPGEAQLTGVDRFRMRLLDPRYEVYENGEFVGREIPFMIAPLAEFGLGEYSDVPVVADNSCGERLWSVNVSVLGDPETTFSGFSPQVNLEVRKRNTFFANWCAASNEGFQVASTRPSRNLFREPGVADGFDGAGGSETNLFAKARIQALLDTQPREFITDAYVDGASTELAGRLLFGDYSIFIPASSLAAYDEDGEQVKEGLDLSKVDDIALRLDYISVAR